MRLFMLRALGILRALAAAIVCALVLTPSLASAATCAPLGDYPPGVYTLTVTPSTAPPGSTVRAVLHGASARQPGTLTVDGTDVSVPLECPPEPVLASAPASDEQTTTTTTILTTTTTTPPDPAETCDAEATFIAPTEPGTYAVRVIGAACADRTATAVLAVGEAIQPIAPPSGEREGSDPLPFTGSSVGRLGLVAAAFAATGILAVGAARRRRETHAQPR